jgi:allantoinase
VPEFPAVTPEDISKAMLELADEPTTLMFHAEMLPPASESPSHPSGPHDHYQTFLDSRPAAFETYAIDEVIRLAHLAPKLPLHIVHLSAIEAIPALRAARDKGINITAETCFHYLSLAAENIKNGDTRHKCCPPIRGGTNQDGLWDELTKPSSVDSVIKTVVSDHSPCTPNLKLLPIGIGGKDGDGADREKDRGDFFGAWGGISSVGLGLSILWTERHQGRRKFEVEDVVKWCCVNTAKQVGLEQTKGSLAVGMDADVAVFDDEAEFVVQPSTMLFRNKCSPYENKTLRGIVTQTWLRGRKIHTRQDGFEEGEGGAATGQLLLQPRST